MEHPQDAVFIDLTRGYRTLIDAADFERVSVGYWNLHVTQKGAAYAQGRFPGSRKVVALHRFLIGAAGGQVVDHVNGNGLDNRCANLRLCDPIQNAANSRRPTGASGYRGVFAAGQKWSALIGGGSERRYLGVFDTAEAAARQYDNAARIEFGEFAVLNFPKAGERGAAEVAIKAADLAGTPFAPVAA